MEVLFEKNAMKIDSEQKKEHKEKDALAIIHNTLKSIRNQTPGKPYELSEAASSDVRRGYLDGAMVKRLVVTLRSSGCGWVEEAFGCTMCGHYAGTTKGSKISAKNFVAQFKNEISRYDFADIPILCLYNGGSLLNVDELPADALAEICRTISAVPGIKKVVFETKSKHVTEDVVDNIKKHLRQSDVEIAIGLESSSEPVRSLCLNKGFDSDDFHRAVSLIKKHFGLRLYLMIKPIFLTEAEAIDDAVRSFRYALTLSPDEIHFEPATVQEHTLAYLLQSRGEYRPPWLWSIIEVIKRLPAGESAYISPFAHTPSPLIVPYNCPSCTERVTRLILEDYNQTRDPSVFDGLECDCRAEFLDQLTQIDPRPLAERIITSLRHLS